MIIEAPVCSFHETEPRALVALQDAHWKPLLSWTRDELAVEIIVFESLLGAVQPQATKDVLNNILMDFDEWQMAGELISLFLFCHWTNQLLFQHSNVLLTLPSHSSSP